MADFALPQSLSISDIRRNAMPAMRRTVLHGSTSQNTYGAGELVYIPVDTGTAGAFFIPETSRLDMTVNILNPNYFVDFINLPRCGFHALIEEFGIEIHNSLHDNQRFYAEMIEQEMIRSGENQVPYEMTVSNPHEVGGGIAGGMHINLIKPSMVTTTGLPHGVAYPVLIQPAGSNISSSVANDITEGLLLNAVPSLKRPTGRVGYGLLPSFHGSAGLVHLTDKYKTVHPATNAIIGLEGQHGMFAPTNYPITSFYDDRLVVPTQVQYFPVTLDVPQQANVAGSTRNVMGYQNITPPISTLAPVGVDVNCDGVAVVQESITGGESVANSGYTQSLAVKSGSTYGFDVNATLDNRFSGYPASGGAYSKYRAFVGAYGELNSDNTMFQVGFGQTVGGYTPLMWPAKQPCDYEKLFSQLKQARVGVNTKNVQNYYANCKNIVCSIPVRLTNTYGADQIWGDKEHTLPSMSDPVKGEVTSFRVSLKLYSCLLGVYAKKWFPSLLIGAGRMRIRLKLQQANIAFQTLMDPCRVVPHTARDRFPFLGVFQTPQTTVMAQSNTVATIGNLVRCPLKSIVHGVHPILISNYEPGACYNDLVCMGRFPVPQMKMSALHDPCLAFDVNHARQGELGRTVPPANQVAGYYTYSHADQALQDKKVLSRSCVTLPYGGRDPHSISAANPVMSYINYAAANAGDGTVTADQLQQRTTQLTEDIFHVMGQMAFELTKNMKYGFPSTDIGGLDIDMHQFNRKGDFDTSHLFAENDRAIGVNWADEPIRRLQNFRTYTRRDNHYNNADEVAPDSYSGGDVGTQAKILPAISTLHGSDIQVNALNWQIYNYPLVQYVPTRSPWDKRTTRHLTTADFVNESELCYGTYLERSKAQVRRTNRNLFSLGTNNDHFPGISNRLTFTVSNITYRVEEVILPESASMQIIASAMEGGITMEADSVKSIEQILQKQDNQKILLNVSGGIVNDITFLFQPTETLQGDKAYGYNSYAFYCPWTSFKFIPEKQPVKDTVMGNKQIKAEASTPDAYNYLGGSPQYHNALHMGENIGINTFLSIATEYFPRNPINDLQTLIDHVTWGDQRRGDIEYLGLDPMLQNSYDTANFQKVFPFQDGFFSVFTPIETLNDQTITDNPFWTPLEENVKKLVRGTRGNSPALPFLKPLDGTFHLSFNLQAFMGQHDRMNVGTPMVNNNSYLQMQNCHLLREHECRMLTFIRCFARIVIERGGIVQIFT